MLGVRGHGDIELTQATDKEGCFLRPLRRRNLRCRPGVEAAGPGHLSQGGTVRSALALENLSPGCVCPCRYPGLLSALRTRSLETLSRPGCSGGVLVGSSGCGEVRQGGWRPRGARL